MKCDKNACAGTVDVRIDFFPGQSEGINHMNVKGI